MGKPKRSWGQLLLGAIVVWVVLFWGLTFMGSNDASATALEPTWDWRPQIEQAAATYDVPAGLIQATMAVESGGSKWAESYAGAIGLMQVMPAWFNGGEDPFDPVVNINKGAYILRLCQDQAGGGLIWESAMGCYLTGHPTLKVQWYIQKVQKAWVALAAQGA